MLVRLNPQIWMLQETKLKPSERIKSKFVDDFQVFYLSRQNCDGGGIALGVTIDLESTLIREGDDCVEAMAVHVLVGNLSICLMLAYRTQENELKENKDKFLKFIEEEVVIAENEK
jgi:hypothetical protein